MNETLNVSASGPAASCCGTKPIEKTDPLYMRIVRHTRAHMAWVLMALAFVMLVVTDPAQAPESVVFVGKALLEIAPFLGLAIGLAAYAKASGADGLIANVFSGRLGVMIFFAALFGGLSPFCSCGVIPLIAALLAMGVPLPAVMAFWLSSPVMDPSMFVLTAATLGMPFAIAKAAAAVGIGLMGGYVTWAMVRAGWWTH